MDNGRSVGDTVAHSVCLLFAYHSTTALIIIKRIEERRRRQKGRLGDMVTLSIDGRQSTVKEEEEKKKKR